MSVYIGDGQARIKVDLNTAPILEGEIHGFADKDMLVCHETVSPDYRGFADILQTATYLGSKGYGIHGVIDLEGYLGWAIGERRAIVYHTDSSGSKGNGHVNTRSIGIELVSRVMLDYPDQQSRWRAWWKRDKQIDKLAQVIAYMAHLEKFPLRYSDGKTPGITTHWQVTQTFGVQGGHTDCWPRHVTPSGYFPVMRVIREAQAYADKWYGI